MKNLEYNDERTPVVRIIAVRDDGRLIVLKKKELNKWELPGGKIEKGETRFDAAKRELEEETGLKSENFSDLVRVEIEDENGCANAYIVFTSVSKEKVEITQDEHSDFKWVEPEDYRSLEFHYHSAYSVPAVERLDNYLCAEKN